MARSVMQLNILLFAPLQQVYSEVLSVLTSIMSSVSSLLVNEYIIAIR